MGTMTATTASGRYPVEGCGCADIPCTCSIRPEDVRAFRRQVRALNRTVARITKYLPSVAIYMESDTMLLLTGAPHDGGGGRPRARRDRVRASVTVLSGEAGAF